jgi:hypothetical protein
VSKPASTPAICKSQPSRCGEAKSNAEQLHAPLTANNSDGNGHKDNPGADLNNADKAAEPKDNQPLNIYVHIEVKGAKGKVKYKQCGPAVRAQPQHLLLQATPFPPNTALLLHTLELQLQWDLPPQLLIRSARPWSL